MVGIAIKGVESKGSWHEMLFICRVFADRILAIAGG